MFSHGVIVSLVVYSTDGSIVKVRYGDSWVCDLWYHNFNSVSKNERLSMSFFQKNKTIITILLMTGFFIAILLIFVSGISGADSNPTPVVDVQPQQSVLATSTGNVPSAPLSDGTLIPEAPSGTPDQSPNSTAQATTESTPQAPATEVIAVTNTSLPPATDDVNEEPPGTDFPPPLTFVPLPTETPPPGNGPPPGS